MHSRAHELSPRNCSTGAHCTAGEPALRLWAAWVRMHACGQARAQGLGMLAGGLRRCMHRHAARSPVQDLTTLSAPECVRAGYRYCRARGAVQRPQRLGTPTRVSSTYVCAGVLRCHSPGCARAPPLSRMCPSTARHNPAARLAPPGVMRPRISVAVMCGCCANARCGCASPLGVLAGSFCTAQPAIRMCGGGRMAQRRHVTRRLHAEYRYVKRQASLHILLPHDKP